MGRDLSTPPSAFHSDTFISVRSAPLRSALHLPTFKPYPLFSLPPCVITSSLPYLTIALSSSPGPVGGTAHHCFKSFSCNTYRFHRKCCKQKTYVLAKFFRCNTYKKQGRGQSRAIFRLTVQLSTVNLFRLVLQRITGYGSRPAIPCS